MTDAELEELEAARAALLNYGQADMDGIIVTTSRQAIHEVDDALTALFSTIRTLKAELEKRDRVLEAARHLNRYMPETIAQLESTRLAVSLTKDVQAAYAKFLSALSALDQEDMP